MNPQLTRIKDTITRISKKASFRYILIVTFFLFFSKGLGFLRQVLIYQKMDPIASELFFASLTLPSTITSFLVSGTIITSVLPIASRLETTQEHKVSRYINLTLTTLLGALGILCFFALIFTKEILYFTTSQDLWKNLESKNLISDYILTTRILLLSPLALTAQSVLGIFLNIKKKFAVYSWAGVIYNLGAVAGLVIGGRNDYILTSIGMMTGVILSVLLYGIVAKQAGLKNQILYTITHFKLSVSELKEDMVQTWKLFFPRIFILNGAAMALVLMKWLADKEGQLTYFDIGLSIQEIFLTLVISVGTVFFPDLAQVFNDKDSHKSAFWHKLNQYTKGVLGIALLGSVVTIFGAPLILWIFELFGKGQGRADYIVLIARVSTLSLIFQSLNEILSKYFHVRERIWQPVTLSVVATLAQIISTLILSSSNLDRGVAVALGLGINNLTLTLGSYFIIQKDYKADHQASIPV
jgi:peptidoglycan biosynthesis protein MviN/MurJ (putative lipid II flippase)